MGGETTLPWKKGGLDPRNGYNNQGSAGKAQLSRQISLIGASVWPIGSAITGALSLRPSEMASAHLPKMVTKSNKSNSVQLPQGTDYLTKGTPRFRPCSVALVIDPRHPSPGDRRNVVRKGIFTSPWATFPGAFLDIRKLPHLSQRHVSPLFRGETP